MNKKEMLIRILSELEPIWSLASGMKILVENGDLGDNMLNTLIDAIKGAVHTVKSDAAKEKLEKGLNIMDRMREIEEKSKFEDEKDLAELDKMIQDF